jgi:predicted DsbA family dithiol-disulfide isomerase
VKQPGRRIEVFAEITCPFTHVGLRSFVAERARRGTTDPRLILRAWPLERVNREPLDPGVVAEEIAALRAEVAPDLFQRFDGTRFPTTSIAAFGLAAAAYRVGDAVGESVSLAIRHALFEEGRDVGDDAVLREIGALSGVQPFSPGAASAAVDADWAVGQGRGVQGSPHFFVDDRAWFCPSLMISHDAGRVIVRRDDDTLAGFYAAVFGDSSSR